MWPNATVRQIYIMWNATSKRVPRGALAIPITRAAYSQTHTCTHYQMASEHFLITKCLSWLLASTGALRIQQLSSKMLISQFTFVHFFCSGWLARQKSLTQGGCDGFVSNITPRLSESKLQADGWWMSAAIAHTHLRWVTFGRRKLSTHERSKSGSGKHGHVSQISWETINLSMVTHKIENK